MPKSDKKFFKKFLPLTFWGGYHNIYWVFFEKPMDFFCLSRYNKSIYTKRRNFHGTF